MYTVTSKKLSKRNPELNLFRFEEVIKCKWSLVIMDRMRSGAARPSYLLEAIPGISKKILFERLNKLERFEILSRHQIQEKPPVVKYQLSRYGNDLLKLVDQLKQVELPEFSL